MKNLASMTLLSARPWFCGIGGGDSVRHVDVAPAVLAKLSSSRRLAAWITARTAGMNESASLWTRHIGWAIVWTLSLLLTACGGGDPANPGTTQATQMAASVVKGVWSTTGTLGVARYGHTATLLLPSGKVFGRGR